MLPERNGLHSSGIQCHCRTCNVDYVNLDNHLVSCSYLTADVMNEISIAGDDATRKCWSQHCLENAFNYVLLANTIRGIFGATLTETMHCFRKGMIEVVTFLVLKKVLVSKRAALDWIAIDVHKLHRQTACKMYSAEVLGILHYKMPLLGLHL